MTWKTPRFSALLALLLVGALIAGCAGPDESATGPPEGAAGEGAAADEGEDPGEPSLPAFDPAAGGADPAG